MPDVRCAFAVVVLGVPRGLWWRQDPWQYNLGPIGLGRVTCSSAISPDRTESRLICATRGGALACYDSSVADWMNFSGRLPERLDFDDKCDAARRAIEGAGALPPGERLVKRFAHLYWNSRTDVARSGGPVGWVVEGVEDDRAFVDVEASSRTSSARARSSPVPSPAGTCGTATFQGRLAAALD